MPSQFLINSAFISRQCYVLHNLYIILYFIAGSHNSSHTDDKLCTMKVLNQKSFVVSGSHAQVYMRVERGVSMGFWKPLKLMF